MKKIEIILSLSCVHLALESNWISLPLNESGAEVQRVEEAIVHVFRSEPHQTREERKSGERKFQKIENAHAASLSPKIPPSKALYILFCSLLIYN